MPPEVLAQVERVLAVPDAGPKAGNTLEDCRSGDSALKEEVDDAGVDRHPMMLCAIAQVDGHSDGFSRLQHFCLRSANEDFPA